LDGLCYPLTQERDHEAGYLVESLEPSPVADAGQNFDAGAREHVVLTAGLIDRDVNVSGAEYHQRVSVPVA